jgi:cysteine desulfurase / selenocysteine lyase
MNNYNDIESELIRRDFQITKKKIYMNNGSIAPTPLSTIKSITDTLLRYSIEGPDSKTVNEYITSLIRDLRNRISHLINCEPKEIIFTQSTTEGINCVCNGIDWKATDSIIVRGGSHEHYANYLPWLNVSKIKRVKLIELKIDENGYFDLTDLERLLSSSTARMENKKRMIATARKTRRGEDNATTRLITLSHALYNNGAIMPVEEVGKIANKNNVLFCIDAAQTVGSINVDVKKIHCDFMAFPAFKWVCGPLGIGILYCNERAAEILSPQYIGSESATLSDQKVIGYLESPQKFQAGFRNYPGLAGLESSLKYILRLGITNIHRRNTKIANVLRNELSKIPDVKIYGPEDENMRTSIVSFSSIKMSSQTIVNKLEENEVIFAERDVGRGRKVVRASPHFFNSEEESVHAADHIRSILK